MRFLLAILVIFTLRPAVAQTVAVTTGDHASFTRLVLTLPAATDWTLGRTQDGYIFRVAGAQPGYDLSQVFQRISRARLSAIWADPEDGSLRLGVGCPCHALPFEFRPGTVVIDLKDGPPPPGSSFELTLDGEALAALTPKTPPRPKPRATQIPSPFVWHRLALEAARPGEPIAPAPAPKAPDPALLALREDLLMEFSRSAAEGLIDPARPSQGNPPSRMRSASVPINLRLGEPLDARTGLALPRSMAAQGQTCPDDQSLALAEWGDGRPIPVQMAEAMADLTGEFDEPDPAAVSRAVRFLLHVGFGAEAAALLKALPVDHPDASLWQSLARLVDGDEDPNGAFRALAACDSPAALWAALADRSLSAADINTTALLRAFSALPPQLRQSLGPDLAESFLQKGDRNTATALHDALSRLPGLQDPRSRILASRIASAYGATPDATEALQAVLEDPGPAQLEALVTLVELHAAEGRPLDPAQADALAAFLSQAASTPMQSDVARAHVLALALTDRFDAAFSALPQAPDATADLWRLLSLGSDSALLHHAIGSQGDGVPPAVREVIATRLHDLGFPEEAAAWMPGRQADTPPASTTEQSAILARDWGALDEAAPAPWQSLAAQLDPIPPTDAQPLARGRALTASSAETRAAISALLDTVPAP
ncbi:tetratricopeptide repeat protein [Paragemmobacter ruber]|uniref:HEAT repeat domain-containing protein n=1 Tax=Paragemmobacter ruber TaxID=1985673 RepID=A0ABW9Y4F0_9RHOB|nr:hypothetical protein [Rhodobacter ruber]NBE07373.1 hypothetical protein [Rhodobacter ruber]